MNIKSIYKQIAQAFTISAAACIAVACANIGNPSGGPRDEDPPILIKASPANGELNVNKTKMTLTFDEIVNVKDAFSKVVVSPPYGKVPRVEALGNKVVLSFDSLKPNTTYTVDFADAIEDNNEGNKLQGFSYSFSTGNTLDSLRVAGMVLDARNLEPRQGILVGVHENLNDSAFSKLPMIRLAKTNDKGEFVIRGLKHGTYRIFALDDKDNDFKYANQEEDIAFFPELITPSSEQIETADSIYNNSTGKLDTVLKRMRTRFLPNDILLRTFNSMKRPQYLVKNERIDSTRVFLKFNMPLSELPELEVLSNYGETFDGTILERSLKNDSLIFWLPQRLVKQDSLRLEARYLRTDSTGNLSYTVDSLKLFTNKPKPAKNKNTASNKSKKTAQAAAADSLRRLTMEIKLEGGPDINKPISVEFPTPLAKLDSSAFHVQVLKDTTWIPYRSKITFSQRDSVSPRNFILDFNREFDTKYKILVDTLAATGIYGKTSLPAALEFTTKKQEDYCTLSFSLSGLDQIPYFVELLDGSDRIVDTQKVERNRVTFRFIPPGKYYARIIEDYNGDTLFSPGDYNQNLQPDLAYYYPKAITLKKNWDKEEQWDVYATPIDQMKPDAIKKNKPTRQKHEKASSTSTDEEEEDLPFDPTANPFDPNQKNRRKAQGGSLPLR